MTEKIKNEASDPYNLQETFAKEAAESINSGKKSLLYRKFPKDTSMKSGQGLIRGEG